MLSLDADELLSANWQQNAEWQRLVKAPKGTTVLAQFVNVLRGLATCWRLPDPRPIGYVDDRVARIQRMIQFITLRVPSSEAGHHSSVTGY
jgi:hypothetical protein